MRVTGPTTQCAVVCVNGGQSREVEGTWSATIEWLVQQPRATRARARLRGGALSREVVAAPRVVRRGRASGRPGGRRPARRPPRLLDGRSGLHRDRGRAGGRRRSSGSRPGSRTSSTSRPFDASGSPSSTARSTAGSLESPASRRHTRARASIERASAAWKAATSSFPVRSTVSQCGRGESSWRCRKQIAGQSSSRRSSAGSSALGKLATPSERVSRRRPDVPHEP